MGQDDDKGHRLGAAWKWLWFWSLRVGVWATFVLILMIHQGILPPFKRYFHPDGHWVALVLIHHVVRQGLIGVVDKDPKSLLGLTVIPS